MKKTILISVFALFAMFTFAQEESFKTVAGDKVFGVCFQSPFASGSPFSLVNGGLNFKYFASENMAYRVEFNYTRNSNNDNVSDSILPAGATAKIWQVASSKTSSSNLDLKVGIEKHMAGTKKLSPYYGADLIVGKGFDKEKDTDYNGTAPEANYKRTKKQSSTSLGLRFVVGAEYYIFPKVYIGTEFGWGHVATFVGKAVETIELPTPPNPSDNITQGSKNSRTGASMTTGAFMVGFVF